jgi:hypothetical protein
MKPLASSPRNQVGSFVSGYRIVPRGEGAPAG